MTVKISALPGGVTLAGTDVFPVVNGGDTKKVSWSEMVTAFGEASDSEAILSSKWTSAPLSSGSIGFSDTSDLAVGVPLKIVQSSVVKYYVITAISANTSISVSGPPLSGAITTISLLPTHRLIQADLFIPGGFDYSGDDSALLLNVTHSRFQWNMPTAYLCRALFSQATPGTDTQPTINVQVGGVDAITTGVTLGGTTAWVSNAIGGIVLAQYCVDPGTAIDFDMTAGGNQDSRDLSVSLLFVLE